MTVSTTITISGKPVEITDDQVFLATRGQTPKKATTYGVIVDRVEWTPIHLIHPTTGVPGNTGSVTNYNSHTALKALRDLGFRTTEPVEYKDGEVVVRESRKLTKGEE